MGNILKMSPADLIRKANRSEKIEVTFDIPMVVEGAEEKISALLTAPDMFEIAKQQERCKQKEYMLCVNDGLHLNGINEEDWQNEISKIEDSDTRKRLQENKPKNLADQISEKNSRLDTIRVLLPKVLKNPETRQLLFPTIDDQKEFGEYISSHPSVMSLLTTKYIEIMNKLNEVNKTVKNLPAEQDSTNSGSNVQ